METRHSYPQYFDTYKTNYFTQFCITEQIVLPEHMPDIDQILNCVIDPEILSLKAINTMEGMSFEGQKLTGKKVVIELKLKQKLLYIAKHSTQSVHVIENDCYQSAYIVIPCQIEGTDPKYLLKYKYLKPEIVIEDIYYSQINTRYIYKHINIMIQLVMVPTFELCYSVQKKSDKSELFMMYKEGQNNIALEHHLKNKSIKPKWSPNGDELAFLSNDSGNWMLYVYCINTETIKRITNPDNFYSITGFCWSADGTSLYFTASDKNTKEIFVAETNRIHYKQLTYGENVYSSYQPKCSPDGKQVAYIRFFFNLADLWIMNSDGTNCRKITNDGFVTSFDWSADGNNILYLSHCDSSNNIVCILNIVNKKRILINICDSISRKRKITYSPNQQYFAFIGTDASTDNLYIYDINHKTLQNATKYDASAKISDYTWSCDGTSLYYCVNDLFYYNIFSFELNTDKKSQLTFATAAMMDIDYRPRIR